MGSLQDRESLLVKKVSRTLYFSFAVLPKQVKSRLSVGYLVCRAMDSVADNSNLSISEKKDILSLFHKLIFINPDELCLRLKSCAFSLNNEWEEKLLSEFKLVAHSAGEFNESERKALLTLIKGVLMGMETDLSFFGLAKEVRALPKEKDLILYCRRIGGVPGLYWYNVYNNYLSGEISDIEIRKSAYSIGEALQLVNIVKDIKEDLLKGRCYFPEIQLKQRGLLPCDLLREEKYPAFKPILSNWILRAVDLLDCCEPFVMALNKNYFALRAAVIWPVYWAMDTLHEVAVSNPLSKKVKIGKKKIYSTFFKTPSLLLSNCVFRRGYRFRREAVITALSDRL